MVETEKEKKIEKHVHQDFVADSAIESETIKIGDKIVIASDQEGDIQKKYQHNLKHLFNLKLEQWSDTSSKKPKEKRGICISVTLPWRK